MSACLCYTPQKEGASGNGRQPAPGGDHGAAAQRALRRERGERKAGGGAAPKVCLDFVGPGT